MHSTEERTRIENLPSALAFASGSAVTQAVISSLVKAGGHVVSVNDVYGGTYRYLTKVAPNAGVQTTFIEMAVSEDVQDLSAHEKEVADRVEAAFRPETQVSDAKNLAMFSYIESDFHGISSSGSKLRQIRHFA